MWQGLYMGSYWSHARWNGRKGGLNLCQKELWSENNEVKLLWDMNIQCNIRLLRQVLRTYLCGTWCRRGLERVAKTLEQWIETLRIRVRMGMQQKTVQIRNSQVSKECTWLLCPQGTSGCYGYEWLSWNVCLHENSQSSELNNVIITIIILIIMWPKKTVKLW